MTFDLKNAMCTVGVLFPLGGPLVLTTHSVVEIWQRLPIVYSLLMLAMAACAARTRWSLLAEAIQRRTDF